MRQCNGVGGWGTVRPSKSCAGAGAGADVKSTI